MTTTLHLGPEASRLLLPVLPHAERPRPSWAEIGPDEPDWPGYETIDGGTTSGYGEISSIDRNPQTGAAKVVATSSSATRYPWGEEHNEERITHEARDDSPQDTSVRGEYSTTVKLADRTLRWESHVLFRSDRESFHYSGVRRLFKDGVLLREKAWEDSIPRDHQ
jgi:hypothetical protein